MRDQAKELLLKANEAYNQANFVLASSLYGKITEQMDEGLYARAQLLLGLLKIEEYNLSGQIKAKYLEEAKYHWLNISFETTDDYYQAQLELGRLEIVNNNVLQAKEYWDKIIYSDDVNSRKRFKHLIGYIWHIREEIGYDFLIKHINKTNEVLNNRNIWHELMFRIADCDKDDFQKLLSYIFNITGNIVALLHLGNKHFSEYDSAFAHYTRHTNALRVIDKEKSAFRLSSMHFMNDPTEGNLINKLLDIDVSNPNNDSRHLAFASCFSFNHNSLNQFRLYGKTDGQENSGVSLVFNKGFFQMDMSENTNIDASIARMQSVNSETSNIFFTDKKQDISPITTTFDEPEKICLYQEKQKKEIGKVEKQPLCRCIYVDPESGYLRVARRSKISFYRSSSTQENAKEEYKKYVEGLDEVDEQISEHINTIKLLVEKLKEHPEHDEDIWTLVNDILLPLRYLIKHAAFEEEEECRMIYITDMCDPKIQSDPEKKWLYVEYAEPVKDHVNKVYLGDGAKDYRPFFERALGDKSKVKDSKNPFRT